MNIRLRPVLSVCYVLSFLFLCACRNQENKPNVAEKPETLVAKQKDYLSLIIALDTLPSTSIKQIVLTEDSLLSHSAQPEANPYYFYFKARKYMHEKKRDSALASYEKMKGNGANTDIEFLKTCGILNLKIGNGSMVEPGLMSQIFSTLKAAEKVNSKLTYRFYDLLAQSYFQNHDEKRSLEYASIYFKHQPFNTHPVIKQRYYDISFLLASRLEDFEKMRFYNIKARQLAISNKDSLAIARTYDNEAQVYSKQLQHKKALNSSLIYFDYLKRSNNLNDIAYNNLATAYYQNNQPDSAIKFFKAGMVLEKLDQSGKRKDMYFNGLKDAYKMKGDYFHALQTADSAYLIELRNFKSIEAVKVAEIHEQYKSEKKDHNIAELNARNQLNETIIKQQRWTIFLTLLVFLGILFFFFVFYRQQRLNEKNKLLKSENQRLNVEQKMLQAQLNPHFIFNAIANLQSLIATGHQDESVKYLKSFSGLLRSVLEQNRKDFIELEEEIDSLNNYLQLQKMRYDEAFEYHITVDDDLDVHETFIPPMLIQPFVENAIEHGFRNIAYKGILSITFELKANLLWITIDDNGIGLTTPQPKTPEKQSLAQVILKERIDLLYTAKGQKACFTVRNKETARQTGVNVEIQIPII